MPSAGWNTRVRKLQLSLISVIEVSRLDLVILWKTDCESSSRAVMRPFRSVLAPIVTEVE